MKHNKNIDNSFSYIIHINALFDDYFTSANLTGWGHIFMIIFSPSFLFKLIFLRSVFSFEEGIKLPFF